MFLKKSSEMFRRTSVVSVVLFAPKLYYKAFNNSKPRVKASRKSLKKILEEEERVEIPAKRISKKVC